MTQSVLPQNFRTSLPVTGVLEVSTPRGDLLLLQDLHSLACKLLNGITLTRTEQSAAGAAIVHLLAHS